MTLRLRLLLVLVGIVAAGLLISDLVTYSSLESFLVTRLDQQLRAAPTDRLVNQLGDCASATAGTVGRRTCTTSFPLDVPDGTFAELKVAGQTIWACLQVGSPHVPSQPPTLPSVPTADSTTGATIVPVGATGCGASANRALAVNVTVGGAFGLGPEGGGLPPGSFGQPGVLIVAMPLTSVNQTLGRLLLVEGLVTVTVLAGLGGLAWFMVRRGLRPLDEMTATAGAIAAGDLTRRVAHTDSHTEVGQLGGALNKMLSEIEAAFAARAASEERLRRFLADASHELRTPLTAVRGYAEMFDRGAADRPEDLATSMRHIRAEANRMSELVDDLLLLARLDQSRPLQHEPVDLVAVTGDAVDAARVADPGRAVRLGADGPVTVMGDASRLRQVVDNLLRNALTHTPEGTSVEVTVSTRHDVAAAGGSDAGPTGWQAVALIEVRDHGPGVAPDEQARIFEPFHRSDRSRARTTGGAGLGLAIVSAIAHAHGGVVGVTSPAPPAPGDGAPGAVFWVRLPAAAAPANGSAAVQAAPHPVDARI